MSGDRKRISRDHKLGRAPLSVSRETRFGHGSSITRGFTKIEGAIRAFNFDFRDKIVLDIGSSTGGFTEAALNHGAKQVIAVEKGSHQMKAPLRFDPRIDLREKTDIFDVFSEGHAAASPCPVPDIVVADVSFISLRPILSHVKKSIAGKHTELLVMLKPQFEARPDQLTKGVVKNERIRRDIIKNFEAWLKQNNFIIMQKRDNDLKGKNGNLERFYHLLLAK